LIELICVGAARIIVSAVVPFVQRFRVATMADRIDPDDSKTRAMNALQQLADGLSAIVDFVGRAASWLCLPLVLLLFLQLPLRDIVHGGDNTDNDFGQIVFANFFMVGIPYAMRHDAHVRLDIFHQHFGPRWRAIIELAGTALFTLPWLTLLGWYALPIVLNSLRQTEKFAETFTPGYFILKLGLFFFVALVAFQALANIIRAGFALAAPRPGDTR
jgi:TRAP-type mannitol/chloroaromatic compound transport system permease small subunit